MNTSSPDQVVVGIDEVGRGAWAGPLLVGAVVLGGQVPVGVTDSKLIPEAKRRVLSRQIKASARGIGLGWVSARELDLIGLSPALTLGAARAVAALGIAYDLVIIDGSINFLPALNTLVQPKADLNIPAVAAASIVAKVARDAYMQRLHSSDPRYGFNRHVGYGTKAHQQAISLYGPSNQHRHSFAPIAAASKLYSVT
jgi:ribonuclease HII